MTDILTLRFLILFFCSGTKGKSDDVTINGFHLFIPSLVSCVYEAYYVSKVINGSKDL